MADIRVNRSLAIPLSELELRFTPSGGPGGQHANKASTRVEVRFDVAGSPSLGASQRARLLEQLGPVVRVVVDNERSQLRNRGIALERLAERLAEALRVETRRVRTRPTRGSQRRRVEHKRRRSQLKSQRRRPRPGDE